MFNAAQNRAQQQLTIRPQQIHGITDKAQGRTKKERLAPPIEISVPPPARGTRIIRGRPIIVAVALRPLRHGGPLRLLSMIASPATALDRDLGLRCRVL